MATKRAGPKVLRFCDATINSNPVQPKAPAEGNRSGVPESGLSPWVPRGRPSAAPSFRATNGIVESYASRSQMPPQALPLRPLLPGAGFQQIHRRWKGQPLRDEEPQSGIGYHILI